MTDRSQAVMITPKGRGRPRVDLEPLSSLSIRLPQRQHDQLARIAHARDKSISEVVRDLLVFRLR